MMGYTNNSSSGTAPAAPTAGFPAGYTINIGLGSTSTGTKPLFTYDIVGHEFMHIVDKHTVNIAANNSYAFEERFILFEGMCDVMGITIESKYKQNDWIIGDDVNFPEKRNLQNPHLSNSINGYDVNNFISTSGSQPKIYNEPSKWINPATLPSGTLMLPSGSTLNLDKYSRSAYAHHNNGVFNYWFYLLAEGNSNAVGIDVASNIAFLAWKDEFISYGDKNFHTFRDATLKIAFEKYDCNTWQTVRQAWDAVGVTGSTCEIAVKITTSCPSPSTCSANITTCGGSSTGTRIKITGGGLTSPIKSNTGQLNTTNLVCGNTYTVEVTDKNNPAECVVLKAFTCQDNAMGSITPPSPPCPIMTASYNVINDCNDKNDLTPLLPEGTYTYNWSNGSTSQNLTNVPSGTYSLTFTDVSNGCSYQESFNVIGLSEPTIIEHVTNLCNAGNQNGAINLMLFNTTAPPYTYQWSTGATTSSLNNLGQGTYNLTITDGNNCTHERSFYVAVKTPAIWGGFALPSCPLRTDGAITPNFVGGTAPYTFQWNNGKTTQNINNLSVGSYKLTITDANGCIASKTFNVTPETSYTFADNLGNCKRIYTCHGQTYSEDMLDYDNIDYDYDECYSFTPCKLEGGSGLPTFGNKDWYLYEKRGEGMKCKFTCNINGTEVDVDPNLIATSQEAGPCNNGGTWVEFYCNGEFVEGRCDEYVKVGNPNPISVYPNPFINKVSIKFITQSDETATFKLYNITGQEVWNKSISTQIGENELIIQFDELSSGVYFLQLENSNGESYYHKLIHQ